MEERKDDVTTKTSISEFPELMTTAEVGQVFGVTSETIREWIKDGKFPNAIRPVRSFKVPKSDVIDELRRTFGDED